MPVFHAYQNCSNTDRLDVLRTLFEQPGLHIFPFVEIPLNSYLFHMDVAPVTDEDRWQRFIFDTIGNLLELSVVEDIIFFRIYIQTKRASNADYQLKRIVEISKTDFASGESVFVFLCADGSIEIDSIKDLRNAMVTKKQIIWSEPEITD